MDCLAEESIYRFFNESVVSNALYGFSSISTVHPEKLSLNLSSNVISDLNSRFRERNFWTKFVTRKIVFIEKQNNRHCKTDGSFAALGTEHE